MDESIQLNDDLRCPTCGKRIVAEAEICPACGTELLVRKTRMRCARCGNRILASVDVCPRCGGDPRVQRFPWLKRVIIGVVVVVMIACMGWVLYRGLATDAAVRAFGLIQPISTPTQVVQVTYVIATAVRPAATFTPSPVPTFTPRFSPTPTKAGAKTTVTKTPTVILPNYAAPQLVTPLNNMIYANQDYTIPLEWQAVASAGLRENEWYAITIQYQGRDNSPAEQKRYSKETRWVVPNDWWKEISADNRNVRWNVSVIRIEGVDPFTALTKSSASPTSVTRTFIWK